MKKVWQITGLGLVIWGLSLVWPVVNAALTSRVADALVVGLVVALSTYVLGRNFTQPFSENQAGPEDDATLANRQPTQPSRPIVFPFSRTPRSTRPIPKLVAPDLHARATQPVPLVMSSTRNSRSTKPMLVAR